MTKLFYSRTARGVSWAVLPLLQCMSSIAWAQIAATATVAATPPERHVKVPALDKLLLSPAQRIALEAARKIAGAGIPGSELRAQPGATTLSNSTRALPDALVISGTVIRAGNRSTVWVNDQPLYGSGIENPVRTLANRVDDQRPGSRDLVLKAKPGQTIDIASGSTVDALPRGAIRIIPPKTGTGAGNTTAEQP